jgi:ribonuclease-3
VEPARWLRDQLGCELEDVLLQQALSHRSVGQRNNERLEFLGDAVLGYIISDELYRRFPGASEGELTLLRVSLVKGKTLAAVAREIDLGAQLRLDAGARHGGGRQRDSILADTLEALFGAIAVERGIDAARQAVQRVYASRLQALRLEQVQKDPKTRLQEYLQARGRPLPEYEVLRSSGEDHARTFFVCCRLRDAGARADGSGRSVRDAEKAAAAALIQSLEREP